MAAELHDFDDGLTSRSPPLEPQIVNLRPSPSPDYLPRPERSPTPELTRSSTSRKRRRPKAQPNPGDEVLIDGLGNYNYPDVAQRAGREALPQSDDSDVQCSSECDRDPDSPISWEPYIHEELPRQNARYQRNEAAIEDYNRLLSERQGEIHQETSRAEVYPKRKATDSPNGPSSSKRRRYEWRQRFDLPLLIRGERIISRPDSGSEDNIIAADVVASLGLEMNTAAENRKIFRLANGTLVRALGQIVINCAFARDTSLQLCCAFYVFRQLICPVLMGMPFLNETETLSRYRHRLQARSSLSSEPFELSSLNSPRQRLYCLVNSQPNLANADTGSELNVISLNYASQRAFTVTSPGLRTSTVQFADGSTARLVGKVSLLMVLGTPEGPRLRTTFYVLDGLTCDILLGEDFLNETEAFKEYRNAFKLSESDDEVPEINGIVWFNTAESYVTRGLQSITLTKRDTDDGIIQGIKQRVDRMFNRKMKRDFSTTITKVSEADMTLDELDARENHRREMARRYIVDLPEQSKEEAEIEEDRRVNAYEQERSNRLGGLENSAAEGSYRLYEDTGGVDLSTQAHPINPTSRPLTPVPTSVTQIPPSITGMFECQHAGCTAAPFLTQYLLNSHEKTHSQERRHFCPVHGCSRSKGGRGFKRKNEMIRHGLVHESPGYICPFCPEYEHKYPRPDNLERHVRVNHLEKDLNDPQLRRVLAARRETGNHQRRISS